MTIEDTNSPQAKPEEMASDYQRELQEKSTRSLPNGVWADKLENGQNLTVGGSFTNSELEIKLNLDFGSFEPRLTSLDPEALRARFEQNRTSLEEWIKSVEETTERKIDIDPYLFYCCQQVQGVVLTLLDHNPNITSSNIEREQVYKKPNPKLSDLVGKSHCAEIAVLAQYALQRAGISSSYVGGITMVDAHNDEEYAEAHSFIVIDNGKYIFDVARPGQHNLPSIFIPKVSLDYDLLKGKGEKLVEAEEVLLGHKKFFGVGEQVASSHHHIVGQ